MDKSKIKSLGITILIIILGIVAFSTTDCSADKLSSDFNQEELRKAAENVIMLINNKDTKGLNALCNDKMKALLTEESMKPIYEVLQDSGKYMLIDDQTMLGTTDKQTKEEFAVVMMRAKYENKRITYTINFDKQLKLAGLFYK